MDDLLPPHLRPINFAGVELLLELLRLTRSVYEVDLYDLIILLWVSDATVRPLMLNQKLPPEIFCAIDPPQAFTGSISRRLLAEKTGIARETVRRKVSELAEKGYLVVDDDDRIRIARSAGHPSKREVIEATHHAVIRYLDRLIELGVDPVALERPASP